MDENRKFEFKEMIYEDMSYLVEYPERKGYIADKLFKDLIALHDDYIKELKGE